MKTTTSNNHTSVTFNLIGKGDTFVNQINQVYAIAKKYKAQDNLFENKSHLKLDKNGVIGEQMGSTGGTVTFHSHSCNHKEAAKELIALLEGFGLANEYYQEVVKTHKADGTPYKIPQTFIERV